MKKLQLISIVALIGLGVSTSAQAACYADYKAKQDNPLRLHYGVAQLQGSCQLDAATDELSARVAVDHWVLLNVLSVFDEAGLEERKTSAGQYFLRY